LRAADAERAPGLVINIAAGERTSINDLWLGIREIVGTDGAARYEAARAGDVRDSLADLSRAIEILEYEPAVGLKEGLRRTVASFSS
jgi:nucleoside-diphosphate-sugar epimerase